MWAIGGIKFLYKLNANIHWLFLLSPSSHIQNRSKAQCATVLGKKFFTTVMTMYVCVPV